MLSSTSGIGCGRSAGDGITFTNATAAARSISAGTCNVAATSAASAATCSSTLNAIATPRVSRVPGPPTGIQSPNADAPALRVILSELDRPCRCNGPAVTVLQSDGGDWGAPRGLRAMRVGSGGSDERRAWRERCDQRDRDLMCSRGRRRQQHGGRARTAAVMRFARRRRHRRRRQSRVDWYRTVDAAHRHRDTRTGHRRHEAVWHHGPYQEHCNEQQHPFGPGTNPQTQQAHGVESIAARRRPAALCGRATGACSARPELAGLAGAGEELERGDGNRTRAGRPGSHIRTTTYGRRRSCA